MKFRIFVEMVFENGDVLTHGVRNSFRLLLGMPLLANISFNL